MLQVNRILGPLIKTLNRMSRDICTFLALASLVILLFSCMAMALLNELPEFSSFPLAVLTLYSWMLGDFSFDIVEPAGVFGYFFLSFYLLLALVVLLNLLIAILSSTFAHIEA